MTKKIFLVTLMVALFVCLFAISVSAVDIPEWTDVITYETGENAIAYKEGFDTTSRVMLANGDGTYSTYPTNYIIKGTDTTFDENEINFTALKSASGNTTYTNKSIVRLEIPVGFTTVNKWLFRTDYGLKIKEILTVKFPEGVTSIGAKMFYGGPVVEIELPDSVETVGSEFGYGSLLTTFKAPKNLKELPYHMFYQSAYLKTLDLTEAEYLETIGEAAFYQCSVLEEAIIPTTVKTISKHAFRDSGLKTLVISAHDTVIGERCFYQSEKLENITIKAENIPNETFYNCPSIKNLILENTKTIGQKAFLPNISGQTIFSFEVHLPEGLTSLGYKAFYQSGATYVYLPSTLTEVGSEVFTLSKMKVVESYAETISENMFYQCEGLEKITLHNTVSIGKYGFLSKSTNAVTEIVLPETLTTIGEAAFGRSSITKLIIPASVTTVGSGAFKESPSLQKVVVLGSTMGASMFNTCTALTEIVVTSNLTSYGDAHALSPVASKFNIYYAGKKDDDCDRVKALMSATSNVSKAVYYSYESHITNEDTSTACRFIYDCNLCEVAYDNQHNIPSETYVFTSFVEKTYTKGICTRCAIEQEGKEFAPIFYGFGYAKRIEKAESNERAMVFSYFINKESLEVYQSYNKGKAISYGVIAVFESKLANGESIINPLNSDGTRVNEKVMNCDLTGKGLTSIDLLIKGDTSIWESVAASPIYMASYVKTSDGIFYLGNQNKEAHQSANIADIDTKTYAELFA